MPFFVSGTIHQQYRDINDVIQITVTLTQLLKRAMFVRLKPNYKLFLFCNCTHFSEAIESRVSERYNFSVETQRSKRCGYCN